MDLYKKSTGVLREFRSFTLRGNALDLAVAVVIGAAFSATVNSAVKNLLTPLIAAVFGQSDFSALTFTINNSVFYYGAFLNALISFVLIAFVVFFLVVKPQSVLRQRLGWDPPDEPQKSPCPRCTTDISIAATRCPSCTSELELGWAAASAAR